MSTANRPGPNSAPRADGSKYFDEYDPFYPDSDGRPMADNTTQERWIATIKGGLDALFRDDPDVFTAADLLWYPVKGQPKIRCAPDALAAFGRPKGDRHSYKTWVEDDVPPHVVFEVLSPGNSKAEMTRKLAFYDRYGVEEYYLYDPETGSLDGWIRQTDGTLRPIEQPDGWTSPRLGITFEAPKRKDALVIHNPDGSRFEHYLELYADRETERRRALTERRRALRAVREKTQAEREKADAVREKAQAEREKANAEREKAQAVREKVQAEREKAEALARAERLAARLRELGLDDEG